MDQKERRFFRGVVSLFHMLQICGQKYPTALSKLISDEKGPIDVSKEEIEEWNSYEDSFKNYVKHQAYWVHREKTNTLDYFFEIVDHEIFKNIRS